MEKVVRQSLVRKLWTRPGVMRVKSAPHPTEDNDTVTVAKGTSWALAYSYSLGHWCGATFNITIRFLDEDLW